MKYGKLNNKVQNNHCSVNITFPIETESGTSEEITLTVLFEDEYLLEEIVEASQCYPILGMINEKLPKGSFVSDTLICFETSKKSDIIDLVVHREVELY
jgi:hypothetical protein